MGLSPESATIFLQSRIPQHAELALYFSMITPLGWLERVPTYKDQIEQLRTRDLGTHGFLGYPVLMTADIAVYRAHLVPVGEDQSSHLEICREIVRRFNGLYGDVFPEPKALFTPTPKVNGIDGRKMSKSYGNTIGITEAAETVREKVMAMVTDPARARRQDPGNPENCNLFPFHELFSPPAEVKVVDEECRTAARGCVDCKKHLIGNLNAALEPFRQKRAELDGAAVGRRARRPARGRPAGARRGRRDDGEGAGRRAALAGAVMADEAPRARCRPSPSRPSTGRSTSCCT